jgi:lipid II:glycine glycyltransferase (peptidoglycan interpeptide bridge formation enzyme)
MAVIEGDAVTPEIEETYFQLHVKDAGGQFRSRESYHLQANLAREREAFYVTATHRGRNVIAGMLLVSVYKGAAYDNSVAVDPDFQDEYVSHLLKWTAIEALNARAVQIYELGEKAALPTTISIPSAKNRGISYFKEGWSRDSTKLVVAAEKFLDSDFLCAITSSRLDAVKTYCAL